MNAGVASLALGPTGLTTQIEDGNEARGYGTSVRTAIFVESRPGFYCCYNLVAWLVGMTQD